MVQLQLLLVSLAAVASVSAVPANQQRINPNFAPKPGQKFQQQKFGANKGKAPAAMWFQPGGVPNKYRPSAGGAASFRGRPGRRPKGGNAGNGNAGAGNANAGAGNGNAGAGNGNQNNAGGNGNNNNAGTGNNNNNNNGGGSNNAVDGAQDTGIANVVELCTQPDGIDSCFLILGDTKGSCFTIPHPIADNVQFFLPPPGGTCSLFDDQDCNAAALAPAQGVVAQNAKLAWSCTAAAAAAPPPATTTTTTAATTTTTTTTSSAAATTTSKANNGGKGNAGKGNAGKGNTGANTGAAKGNTGATKGNTGAAKGNTGATKGNTGAGNTGAAKGNTGAAKGNTGANSGAAKGNTGAGNTGAAKGNTGAAAGAGKGNTGATAGKGNQANAGSGSGTNNAVAGSQNLDFGSCSNPTIQFAQGLPGRNAKEFGFQAVNTQDFPHGAALNIAVITDFVCLQFINKCGLKQDSPTIAACRAAEQAALPLQGGAAADAFNKGLGFETNFAAVGGNGNNGNNGGNNNGNNGNNGGNNNGNNGGNNNGGNNGANGQTDSGVANVIEGCTNPDGATRCFQILADTKESCFTLPPPLANNVAFWLPPPGANCVLFTDQDCTSTPTTAFGVINNVKQNSWSCKLNDA